MVGEVFIECRCIGIPHNAVKVKMFPVIDNLGNLICVKVRPRFLDYFSWFADPTDSEEFARSQVGN